MGKIAHFAPRTRSPLTRPKRAENHAMTDVTVKTFDELDDYAGQFLYAGKGLV